MLTFGKLQNASRSRASRWNGPGQQWTLLEWAGALCGEAGEMANVAKKIRRLDLGMVQGDVKKNRDQLRRDLGEELADVVCYAACLANEAGIDLEGAIVHKFNSISAREGFPERLEQ